MKQNTYNKPHRKHTIIKAFGITVLAFLLLVSIAGATTTVNVKANSEWVNTGITLNANEPLKITASGSWTPDNGNSGYFDPNGSPNPWPDNFFNIQNILVSPYNGGKWIPAPHYCALIGYIGNHPIPRGQMSPTALPELKKIFVVGSNYNDKANQAGTLWLIFNDGAYTNSVNDNLGSVTATINAANKPIDYKITTNNLNFLKNKDPKQWITYNGESFLNSQAKTGLTFNKIYNNQVGNPGYNSLPLPIGKISATQVNDAEKNIKGSCAVFAESLTSSTVVVDQWSKGRKAVGGNVDTGTVIATFGSDGKYDSGHTAIYEGKTTSGITVWDQNWAATVNEGVVKEHTIPTNPKDGKYTSNANNYYVVQVPAY